MQKGLLAYTRILPNKIPPDGKYPAPYGTTAKIVDFRKLGKRDPLTRGERGRIRGRLLAIERHAHGQHVEPSLAKELEGRPRHSAPVPSPDNGQRFTTKQLQAMGPELVRMIEQLDIYYDDRATADSQAEHARALRRPRPPPDG